MNLNFGRKLFGHFFIFEIRTNLHQKSNDTSLSDYNGLFWILRHFKTTKGNHYQLNFVLINFCPKIEFETDSLDQL
jgi:hypothetical protein